MSNLSKETLERIEKDAEVYGEEHQDHLYNVKGYSTYNDLVSGYNAGALHEAERAQPVIDALQELVNLKCIKEQFGKTDEYLNNQPLAWETAANALAKYREVCNG